MTHSVNRVPNALFQVLGRYTVPSSRKNNPTVVKVSLTVNRIWPGQVHYVQAKDLPIFRRAVWDVSRKSGVPISVKSD